MSSKRPKSLIEQVREAIRLRHYSIRTEDAYVHWIIKFILYHDKRHPNEMGIQEIEEFLTHLAVKDHVASSTQNQAYSAILFLYREVLRKELEGPIDSIRAKKPRRLPTVLSKEEVQRNTRMRIRNGAGSMFSLGRHSPLIPEAGSSGVII